MSLIYSNMSLDRHYDFIFDLYNDLVYVFRISPLMRWIGIALFLINVLLKSSGA